MARDTESPASRRGTRAQVPGVIGSQAPGAWTAHGPSGTRATFKDVHTHSGAPAWTQPAATHPSVLLTSSRFGKCVVISSERVSLEHFPAAEPQRFPGPSANTPMVFPVQWRGRESMPPAPWSAALHTTAVLYHVLLQQRVCSLPPRLRDGGPVCGALGRLCSSLSLMAQLRHPP